MSSNYSLTKNERDEEKKFNRRHDLFLCFLETDKNSKSPNGLLRYFSDELENKRFVKIFMNEHGLTMGEYNSIYIIKGLEESTISIVFLSDNFASSTFCLDELVHILECKEKKDQLVLPIYFVNATEIRNQTGKYGEAMAAHELRFGKDSQKLQKWKSALFQVSHIDGLVYEFEGDKEEQIVEYYTYQRKFRDSIVEWVINKIPSYHGFFSFKEKDTRYSFTGHLYNAFNFRRFKTFMKDKGWKDGEQSSQSTIENSSISIVVLSENYAYSSSCLDEIVTIIDVVKRKNRLVLPIFYKVEPSDVRHQRNSYGKAMMEHERVFGKESDKVQTWRSALTQLASFKGWPFKSGFSNYSRKYSNALHKKGFNLLMDEREEEDIEDVSLSILKVLIQCKRSIVVLSKNFAASPYHLNQLAHIVECGNAMRQLISPIYYGVMPIIWSFRTIYGISVFYDEAMTAREERLGTNSEKLKKWKCALSEVCHIEPTPMFETGRSERYELETIQYFVNGVTKPSRLYDVFISFCGEDTRHSFTGYLYDELLRSRINTFMDDEGLVSGNEIPKNLLEAIQSSKLSIVVLSENYAFSTWCLDELVKILECVKTKKQLVLPIFYKMEHSDLSNQTKTCGDAMTAHANRFGKDSPKVQKWRSYIFYKLKTYNTDKIWIWTWIIFIFMNI